MRIGELADDVGMTTKALRFYEQRGLLPEPARTASGYRDYPPDAVERLVFIRDAQFAGLTLAEIGQVLGVTESRVSQIHTKSVLHLRSRLSAAGVGCSSRRTSTTPSAKRVAVS